MKKIGPWVRKNLLIVIVMAVAIIGVGPLLFFSMGWNAKIRKTVGDDVSKTMNELNGFSVEYALPAMLPGDQPVSFRQVPNALATRAFEERLKKISEGSDAVRQQAIERNRAGKELLIGGPNPEDQLFPSPMNERSRVRLLSQMIREWPAAHQRLLERHRAGLPPAPDQVLVQLAEAQRQEVAKITSGRVDQTLSPEEQERVAEALSERRIAIYKNAAKDISFYANADVFTAVRPWPAGSVPELPIVWDWQHTYWIHEDIIRAIARANSDQFGAWMPVYKAPVKLVERIAVEPVSYGGAPATGSAGRGGGGRDPFGGGMDGGDSGGGGGGPVGDESSEIAPDYSVAHTGRVAWPARPNALYDIRYVDLSIIVASKDIPVLIDAIAATNFMSVIDLDLSEVDPFADMEFGLYYGEGVHVVRANLRIETVWFRAWMKQWMPQPVRQALGIPDDPAPTDQQPDDMESADEQPA